MEKKVKNRKYKAMEKRLKKLEETKEGRENICLGIFIVISVAFIIIGFIASFIYLKTVTMNPELVAAAIVAITAVIYIAIGLSTFDVWDW